MLASLNQVAVVTPGDGLYKTGRYVYGVADSGAAVSLGNIGIDNSRVYTIAYKELCAIVHDCPSEPYQSQDKEVVKEWLQTHQRVLDVAMEKFGTVLPMGFDTIVKGHGNADPQQVVTDWLANECHNLRQKMDKVQGKQEFSVQIFYHPHVMTDIVARDCQEVRRLQQETPVEKPGAAYLYKHRVDRAVKEEMERRAPGYFKEFYAAIRIHTEDIKVEKTKRLKDRIMLMNLSCLVWKEKVSELGGVLEKINNMTGFSVRFTGPWPAYSFV